MPGKRTANDQLNYSNLLYIAEVHNSTQHNSLTIEPPPPPALPPDLHYGWIIGICAAATLLIATTSFIITKKAQICCFKQQNFYDCDWSSDESAEAGIAGYCCL